LHQQQSLIIMRRHIFIFLAVILSASGNSQVFTQYEHKGMSLIINPGDNQGLNCSHSIPSYFMILWYQKFPGNTSLNLIGYVTNTNPTVESSFKDRFTVSGNGAKQSTLHLGKLKAEDSAVYYCAASQTQCFKSPPSNTKTSCLQLY
uniref:Ig-like domain-containing protein n=1 Tax=Astyanax mexicanus TaxID=7994 RepID=A0A8B9L2S2_ASTMX